jgi:hypothetical protein
MIAEDAVTAAGSVAKKKMQSCCCWCVSSPDHFRHDLQFRSRLLVDEENLFFAYYAALDCSRTSTFYVALKLQHSERTAEVSELWFH